MTRDPVVYPPSPVGPTPPEAPSDSGAWAHGLLGGALQAGRTEMALNFLEWVRDCDDLPDHVWDDLVRLAAAASGRGADDMVLADPTLDLGLRHDVMAGRPLSRPESGCGGSLGAPLPQPAPGDGRGNDWRWIADATNVLRAGRLASLPRVEVLWTPADGPVATVVDDLAAQTFQGGISLTLFGTTRDMPQGNRRVRIASVAEPVFTRRGALRVEVLAQASDLVLFLDGPVRLDPLFLERLAYWTQNCRILCQPLVPSNRNFGLPNCFAEPTNPSGAELLGLNVAVPSDLLLRSGPPRGHGAGAAMQGFVKRLLLQGAYFKPVAVPEVQGVRLRHGMKAAVKEAARVAILVSDGHRLAKAADAPHAMQALGRLPIFAHGDGPGTAMRRQDVGHGPLLSFLDAFCMHGRLTARVDADWIIVAGPNWPPNGAEGSAAGDPSCGSQQAFARLGDPAEPVPQAIVVHRSLLARLQMPPGDTLFRRLDLLLRKLENLSPPPRRERPEPPPEAAVFVPRQLFAFERRAVRTPTIHFWPDYSRNNPYLGLLYRSIARLAEVRAGTIADAQRDLDRGRAPVVLHLHWLHAALKEARDPAEARRAASEVVSQLARFKQGGGRLVWTLHNTLSHDTDFPQEEAALSEAVALHADLLHVHSPAAIAELQATFAFDAAKVCVSAHGSYIGAYPGFVTQEAARRTLGLLPDEDVLLHVGRLRPYKGLEALLDVFSDLAAERSDLRLVVAGHPAFDVRQHILKTLPLSVRARILLFDRFVDAGELQLLFSACDFTVFPYRSILTSGSALLSLSFGRPAILPSTATTRELIPPTGPGLLYELDGGTDALRAAIVLLLRTKRSGGMPQMQEAAAQAARACSWPPDFGKALSSRLLK